MNSPDMWCIFTFGQNLRSVGVTPNSSLLFSGNFYFSLQSVLNDISIVWQVFSLPILEPMTPVRLNKIITVAMSCLYAAITVTTATSVVALSGSAQPKGSAPPTKDDETENAASGIVQKSVSVQTSKRSEKC